MFVNPEIRTAHLTWTLLSQERPGLLIHYTCVIYMEKHVHSTPTRRMRNVRVLLLRVSKPQTEFSWNSFRKGTRTVLCVVHTTLVCPKQREITLWLGDTEMWGFLCCEIENEVENHHRVVIRGLVSQWLPLHIMRWAKGTWVWMENS